MTRAERLLGHLPHFYQLAAPGGLLGTLAQVFGGALEGAADDLNEVLRAHHAATARNEGAGLHAPAAARGDLDKILALYLDTLGGTSQLVKINPRFTSRTLRVGPMVRRLVNPGRQGPGLRALVAHLRAAWGADVWRLLEQYRVENALVLPDEVRPGLVEELRSGPSALTRAVRDRLEAKGRVRLAEINAATKAGRRDLAWALNADVLLDPSLFPYHYGDWKPLPLPEPTWELLHSLYHEFLGARYRAEGHPPEALSALLDTLARATPAPRPLCGDLPRVNRRLLEAAFPFDESTRPWGLRPRTIPTRSEVRSALVAAFNRVLTDPTLYDPARFPDVPESEVKALRARHAGDVVWVNRRLLEAAFPREVEPHLNLYRERMLGLIQALRRGASTREGIIDIVAANLGITGDDPAVPAARERIIVEEYRPTIERIFDAPVSPGDELAVPNPNLEPEPPRARLVVADLDREPREDGKSEPTRLPRHELRHVALIDRETGRAIRYQGKLVSGDILEFQGDRAWKNGRPVTEGVTGALPDLPRGGASWRFEARVFIPQAFYDGSTFDAGYFGDPLTSPGGELAGSRFDGAYYDEIGFVDEAPVAQLAVDARALTPACFSVTIPWRIPGFTDSFVETDDHPRHQIPGLVDRVKAAGVDATVIYQQVFSETHDLRDVLVRAPTREYLNPVDTLEVRGHYDYSRFDCVSLFGPLSGDITDPPVRASTSDDHDVSDTLEIPGHYDYGRFDGLSAFGPGGGPD